MKFIGFVFSIFLLFNCAGNKESEVSNSKVIQTRSKMISENEPEVELPFQNHIHGIWTSREDGNLLNELNSLTLAQAQLKTYTDIVFNGEYLLSEKPSYMEPAYLKLAKDSTTTLLNGKKGYKILEMNDTLMIILDQNEEQFEYYKSFQKVDISNAYLELGKGSSKAEKIWFKGGYQFILDAYTFKAKINEEGEIMSNQLYDEVVIYSYQDHDLIDFVKKSVTIHSYSFDFTRDSILLSEINIIDDIDDEITLTGNKGLMIRN